MKPKRHIRNHPVARAIVRDFRRLHRRDPQTNPKPDASLDDHRSAGLVIACSGGADSTALVLALATATALPPVHVAHIQHDMRQPPLPERDAQHTRRLADELGLPFHTTAANANDRKTEAHYRTLRYAALAQVAQHVGANAVLTAHHADDQLETLIMGLARGLATRGLRGIAPTRPLAPGITLIRPMLKITRKQARALCRDTSTAWIDDETNRDPSASRRNHIRASVIPQLEQIAPQAPVNASRLARTMRDTHALIEEQAQLLLDQATHEDDPTTLHRQVLQDSNPVVIAEAIRSIYIKLGGHPDRLGHDKLHQAIDYATSSATHPKRFTVTQDAELTVDAHTLAVIGPTTSA